MRLGSVTFVLLMATAIFACGGAELPPVSDPPTQMQQATERSAQQEDEERPSSGQQTRPPEAGRSAESGADARTDEVEKEPPPDDSSGHETAVREPEREAEETSDAALEAEAEDAEAEDAEPEAEQEPEDLTDVPAVVMKDADVHVRAGLSWPVIGRLSAGEEVAVLSAAGGWFRISFGDGREGWIPIPTLDLGDIETRSILHQPAPAIVAVWQGEQYGVMGQSVDGTEVTLLAKDDELAEIVSVPVEEVTLLADDMTVHDLPIVIVDETVVFPSDDISLGQGKMLPKANEWMWLPWGWLLAHNDTHIWQWRPESDQLEFTTRPPGPAKFSPSGKHLAILTSPNEEHGHMAFQDVVVLPLDGASAISLLRQFRHSIATGEVNSVLASYTLLAPTPNRLYWSPDGETIAVRLYPGTWETYIYPALLMDMSGKVTIHQGLPEGVPPGLDCYLGSLGSGNILLDWWWIRDDNTFVIYGLCKADDDGPRKEFDVVFSLGGEFLRVEPFSRGAFDEAASDLVRSAQGGEVLGQWLSIDWSPTGSYALVIDSDQSLLRSYDALGHQLREFRITSGGTWSPGVEEVRLDHALSGLGSSLRWDIYWFDGKTAVVLPWKNEAYVFAGHFLDLADGGGTPLELSTSEYWPCQQTGGWRPDGQQFQLTVGRRVFQLMTFDVDGKLGNVLRLVGHSYWGAAPRHQADWSPNSSWFAIGGHPQSSRCVYGP